MTVFVINLINIEYIKRVAIEKALTASTAAAAGTTTLLTAA